MTPYDVIRCHNYVMAWNGLKGRNGMETIDGVDTDRWEVGIVTEEK